MKFFIPWRRKYQKIQKNKQQIYMPAYLNEQGKSLPSLNDGSLSFMKNKGFCFFNPRGTVQAFLQALHVNHTEEAKVYFARGIGDGVDMDGLRDLFETDHGRCVFVEKKQGKYQTVSLAFVDKPDIISLRMAEEPDEFGKWKIYCIERD